MSEYPRERLCLRGMTRSGVVVQSTPLSGQSRVVVQSRPDRAAAVRDQWHSRFPGVTVVVMDGGLHPAAVIRPDDEGTTT